MLTLFSFSERARAAIPLVLAACLAGCASKNPLIDGEAPVATPAAASTPVSAQTAAQTEAQATASTQAAAEQSGMEITPSSGLRRFLGVFTPYRVVVQQGNFVSREMVDQLREGIQRPEGVNREQVRFVLGTPLLTDIFHADRWDYAFRLQKRSGEVLSSRVTVFFNGSRLARIEGGNLPTEQEYLALIAGEASGIDTSSETK